MDGTKTVAEIAKTLYNSCSSEFENERQALDAVFGVVEALEGWTAG
jgi:hypothetical protein